VKWILRLARGLEGAAGGEAVIEAVHVFELEVVHGEEEMAWGGLIEEVGEGEFGVFVV
jgi:hypothetical protein